MVQVEIEGQTVPLSGLSLFGSHAKGDARMNECTGHRCPFFWIRQVGN